VNGRSFPRPSAPARAAAAPHAGCRGSAAATAEPEKPPFTVVGIAIGKPKNVALVLDQTSKNLVHLHVGEAAEGWILRLVDLGAMTLEKNSQLVTLALPVPGGAPLSPPDIAVAARVNRAF
jgi:hypothetical protein